MKPRRERPVGTLKQKPPAAMPASKQPRARQSLRAAAPLPFAARHQWPRQRSLAITHFLRSARSIGPCAAEPASNARSSAPPVALPNA